MADQLVRQDNYQHSAQKQLAINQRFLSSHTPPPPCACHDVQLTGSHRVSFLAREIEVSQLGRKGPAENLRLGRRASTHTIAFPRSLRRNTRTRTPRALCPTRTHTHAPLLRARQTSGAPPDPPAPPTEMPTSPPPAGGGIPPPTGGHPTSTPCARRRPRRTTARTSRPTWTARTTGSTLSAPLDSSRVMPTRGWRHSSEKG